MTLEWNPSGDFLDTADGLEAVTYAALSGATTAVSGALRRRITEQEAAASGGRYTRRDVRWHLPAAQVTTAPQVGATIADADGKTWTILQVDHDTRRSRWRCWCRLLELSELSDRIDVQQATWAKDDHGGLVATWSNWRSDLPARLQPIEGVIQTEHAHRYVRVTHLVYLGESLELNQNHRILQPATSTVLHIVGYESPKRIDALFAIRAIKSPWTVG